MYGSPNIKPLELTFDWLFDRINQEDVYMKYFGFCQLNKKFCNPLRNDTKADCWFYWHGGILYFHDPAWKQTYTCINVVMHNENCNYYKALNAVYDLFFSNRTVSNYVVIRPKEEHKPKDIKVTIQPFSRIDIEYLKSYGITGEFCKKAKWFSIKHYWINDVMLYTYSNYNPCIGYYFKGKWKLYFYKNREWRFLSNTSKLDVQGYDMLPESGDLLVITKSFKDVGTLYEQGICAVAPQAESILISEEVIIDLKLRFKNVYTLMDYDNTGIHLAWKMRKLYNIKPFFFTDKLWNRKKGYLGAKDISDYRNLYGFQKTKQLIEQLL
jgi:5S rRNA maturation endonuclease (ribonuclease M5)